MYERLTEKTENLIKNRSSDLAFKDENAIRRRNNPNDVGNALRSNLIKDIDKILNCPFFPRYADKTQVFSFYKNDDITHRSMHVNFVSQTAKTIGKALGLNLELIEAIALGHDIGHTPFGHSGEYALDDIYFKNTKKHFYHNLHSVRVLDKIFPLNVSLQTLDGILCHDGESEKRVLIPSTLSSFDEFDGITEQCYLNGAYMKTLTASTLEGLVVRISDIIAYLGKDRQDAVKLKIVKEEDFSQTIIGNFNAEIINNLSINIIENSIEKNYIALDEEHFNALKLAKNENYEKIYFSNKTHDILEEHLKPMMEKLYNKLLEDLIKKDRSSPIFKHHVDYINGLHYKREKPYGEEEPNQIIVDYIASMTDDYFIDLYKHLFGKDKHVIEYYEYF